eukprot:1221924-Rhodomonas_salina.2
MIIRGYPGTSPAVRPWHWQAVQIVGFPARPCARNVACRGERGAGLGAGADQVQCTSIVNYRVDQS